MDYHGIFEGEKRLLVVGSKEKAEEMIVNYYPGAEALPVEEVNGDWVKKDSKK